MAWCVALWRARSGVWASVRRLARDVERKATLEGVEAALRLLERLCSRRPDKRACVARRLVKEARRAVRRSDFRRAQTLLNLLEALARDGTLGARQDVYDAFAEFVWWATSRGAPYARQAMEALAMVHPRETMPFGDAQHAVCLELGKTMKENLVTAPGTPTTASTGSAATESGCSAGGTRRESDAAQQAMTSAALRALVRVVENAPLSSVRSCLPASCFRSGLPAALRACASDSEAIRAEGVAALRALARAASDSRPADFVQPLMTTLLARGALDRPHAGAAAAAGSAAGNGAETRGGGVPLGATALAAVGAAALPVVLFAALRALRVFFWSRQRRCAARKYCDGDNGAESELRDVCASVGGALLAALRGLRCAPQPPEVDAALLQQAAMTMAVETQVATREAGLAGDALFGELLAEILPMARDLYTQPSHLAAEASVVATFRQMLPWLPGEEVLRAAQAYGPGVSVPASTRLHKIALRITEAEFLGMDWASTADSTTQDISVMGSIFSETSGWPRSDENLLKKGYELYNQLAGHVPLAVTAGGDAPNTGAVKVLALKNPSQKGKIPSSPHDSPHAPAAATSDPPPVKETSACSEETPITVARRRRKRRKTRTPLSLLSGTSTLSLSERRSPRGRRPVVC